MVLVLLHMMLMLLVAQLVVNVIGADDRFVYLLLVHLLVIVQDVLRQARLAVHARVAVVALMLVMWLVLLVDARLAAITVRVVVEVAAILFTTTAPAAQHQLVLMPIEMRLNAVHQTGRLSWAAAAVSQQVVRIVVLVQIEFAVLTQF